MELIFILTYNCNYRCRYCDIDKRSERMSGSIREQSLDFISRLSFPIEKVKYFGWEPLLEFGAILDLIHRFPQESSRHYMTTNGSLLTADILRKIQENRIITTLSLDGTPEVTSENRMLVSWKTSETQFEQILHTIRDAHHVFRLNQVITPHSAGDFWKNFEYLYRQWFRSFNFLPEYYTEWTKTSLSLLAKGFQEIRSHVFTHPIHLVNQENYSPTSFFNLGVVIDTDGSVYGTNLILAGRFEKYKKELRIGNVSDRDFVFPMWEQQREYLQKIEYFLTQEYSENVMKSVYFVNKLLSHFTQSYGK